MVSAFIVCVGEWRYAIDVRHMIELLHVGAADIVGRDGRRRIQWRGSEIPLIELRYLLGLGGARLLPTDQSQVAASFESPAATLPVCIARLGERHVAIAVEKFDGQREIIVKSLGVVGRRIKGVIGAVDLEGGDVALVLDLPNLLIFRSLRL
jgi:two-component system, chemotaxis family, sensor kinase CheA